MSKRNTVGKKGPIFFVWLAALTFSMSQLASLPREVHAAAYARPMGQPKATVNYAPLNLRKTSPYGQIFSNAVIAPLASTGQDIVKSIDLLSLRWSQRTAGANGRADAIKSVMTKKGWKFPPINAVHTPQGVVTIDNTRPAVARALGRRTVPAVIHSSEATLPKNYLNDQYWKSHGAKTWGDALKIRTSGQKPPLPMSGVATPPQLMWSKSPRAVIQTSPPGSLEQLTITVKNPGLIGRITNAVKAKFPQAAAAGARFLGKAAVVLGKLGPIFAGAGIIFGLIEMGYSGPKFLEIMNKKGGIFEALGTREGKVTALNTLAGFMGTIAGAAFLGSTATGATIVGAPVAAALGAVAGIAAGLSIALSGAALAVEHWDTIKAGTKKVVNWAQAGVKKVATAAKTGVTKAAHWVGEKTKAVIAGIKKIGQKAGAVLAKAADKTKSFVSKTVAAVGRGLHQAGSLAKTGITKAARWVGDTAQTAVAKVSAEVKALAKKTASVIAPIAKAGATVGQTLKKGVAGVAKKAVGKVVQITKHVAATATPIVVNAASKAGEVTKKAAIKTGAALTAVGKTVKTGVQKVAEKTKEVAVAAKQVVAKGVQKAINNVKDAGTNFVKGIANFFSSPPKPAPVAVAAPRSAPAPAPRISSPPPSRSAPVRSSPAPAPSRSSSGGGRRR